MLHTLVPPIFFSSLFEKLVTCTEVHERYLHGTLTSNSNVSCCHKVWQTRMLISVKVSSHPRTKPFGEKYVSFVRAGRLSEPESAAVQILGRKLGRNLCHLLALDKGLPIKLGFSKGCRTMAHSRHQLALAQQRPRLSSAYVAVAWNQSPHCA